VSLIARQEDLSEPEPKKRWIGKDQPKTNIITNEPPYRPGLYTVIPGRLYSTNELVILGDSDYEYYIDADWTQIHGT
jgi:hypothetical protein